MDRRSLLQGGLAGLGAAASGGLAACTPSPAAPPPPPAPPAGPFDCGVASGLHSPTSAVLWTRFAPAAASAVELAWEVATDPSFTTPVARGRVVASPATDGCAKVLAEGLEPGTPHHYRFSVDGAPGPVGRTRTLPGPDDTPPQVRIAVASCQMYASGFYDAWADVAAQDLDAVVHLGDYIYEKAASDVRIEPTTAVDLAGYRAKYRLYRSDPSLQAAHAAHAFAVVWDDHEFVNDYDRLTVVTDPARAAAAYRAWWEYQPVWPIDGDRIHRRHRFGRMLDLTLLDSRQYRDPVPVGDDGEPVEFGSTLDPPLRQVHDGGRTILGAAQRDWLLDGLGAAQDDGVRWKVLGNQVMISGIRAVDLDEAWTRAIGQDVPSNGGVYANFDD